MELLDQKAVPFLVFWGNSTLFSTVAAPVCIHQQRTRVPFSPHPHQYLLFVDLVMNGHSDQCEVVSLVVLICISLMASDAEHPFICLWVLCMSSLEKYMFKSFAHFLIGLPVSLEWSRVSSLYILEIKSLSEVSLTNMFSPTVSFLLILLMFALAVQKFFLFWWDSICLLFPLYPSL